MELTEYFAKKKINAQALAQQQPLLWQQLQQEYAQLGQAAFDQRKKFFWNDWRLLYPMAN